MPRWRYNARAMRRVTLYTKPDCPLCRKAKGLLGALRAEGIAFELEEVDVTRDPELYERYRFEVPVIAVDGVERFKGRVAREALRAALLSPRTRA